jgi:hypothetical protein
MHAFFNKIVHIAGYEEIYLKPVVEMKAIIMVGLFGCHMAITDCFGRIHVILLRHFYTPCLDYTKKNNK